MAKVSSKNNFIIIISGLGLLVAIFLLWKFNEFKELAMVFLLLIVIAMMLLRYYDE
jgi:hypothetical protein